MRLNLVLRRIPNHDSILIALSSPLPKPFENESPLIPRRVSIVSIYSYFSRNRYHYTMDTTREDNGISRFGQGSEHDDV